MNGKTRTSERFNYARDDELPDTNSSLSRVLVASTKLRDSSETYVARTILLVHQNQLLTQGDFFNHSD